MISIKQAHFLTSAKNLTGCPPAEIAEVALLGRSNVGKSTFINLLLNQPKLAKSSSTPGKTQLINFFETRWEMARGGAEPRESIGGEAQGARESMGGDIARTEGENEACGGDDAMSEGANRQFRFHLVDLPGFGYAKVSKSLKEDWEANLWHFLQYRSAIKLFIHLIDARHRELEIDKRVFETLRGLCRGDQEVLRIYTKCDKLTANERGALAQKGGLLMSSDDKILKKYGGKMRVREVILQKVFGIDRV